jgi:hypothetical protein
MCCREADRCEKDGTADPPTTGHLGWFDGCPVQGHAHGCRDERTRLGFCRCELAGTGTQEHLRTNTHVVMDRTEVDYERLSAERMGASRLNPQTAA